MATAQLRAVEEIDELLSRGGLSPGDTVRPGQFGAMPGLSDGQVTGLTTAIVAALDRLTPPSSPYREAAERAIDNYGPASGNAYAALVGLLNSLRKDYEQGYIQTVAELIHADVFSDFLEMADELLSKQYTDAAAVIVGSVLEEHLRNLAQKVGVRTMGSNQKPKKADTLNADLVKAGAYNKLQQQQVTAWLALRNQAAHGKYDQYTTPQVHLMIEGVRGFLVTRPA